MAKKKKKYCFKEPKDLGLRAPLEKKPPPPPLCRRNRLGCRHPRGTGWGGGGGIFFFQWWKTLKETCVASDPKQEVIHTERARAEINKIRLRRF